VPQDVTFDFTWTGCKAAPRSASAKIPNFSFPGSTNGEFFSLGNFEELFFVNLNCTQAPKALRALKALKAEEGCSRAFSAIQPAGAIVDNKDSETGIDLFEAGPEGYEATATLAACTPHGSTEP